MESSNPHQSPVDHRPRTSLLAALATLALLAGLSTLDVATASAARVYSSFGSPGSGAGQVQSPAGVAVDNSGGPAAGDVYVADTGNSRVDQFDANGNFIRAWGWGVADGISAEFQTCTLTCFKGISGSGAGQFVSPSYIAVDSSAGPSAGDIYVADPGDNLVSKFTPEGALVTGWGNNGVGESPNGQLAGPPVAKGTGTLTSESSFIEVTATESGAFLPGQEITGPGIPTGTVIVTANGPILEISQPIEPGKSGVGIALSAPRFGPIAGIALDPTANLLVAIRADGTEFLKFAQDGDFVEGFVSGYSSGSGVLAVRPVGNLLVSSGGAVTELSALGVGLRENVAPAPTTGLAVDSSEGSLYVDSGTELARYDSSDALVESFGAGDLAGAAGIAVGYATNGGVLRCRYLRGPYRRVPVVRPVYVFGPGDGSYGYFGDVAWSCLADGWWRDHRLSF